MPSIFICRAKKIIVECCLNKQIFIVFYTFITQNIAHDFKGVLKRFPIFPITYLYSYVFWNKVRTIILIPSFRITEVAERRIVIVKIVTFPYKKQFLMCAILSRIMISRTRYKFWEPFKNSFLYNTIFAYSVIKLNLILVLIFH